MSSASVTSHRGLTLIATARTTTVDRLVVTGTVEAVRDHRPMGTQF